MGTHTADFAALNTNIVAISFGTPYWAQAWLEETGVDFPIWLDPDRKAYQAFGLERSLGRAWGPRTLLYYARALLRGETLKEKRGDTDQMGGDFIIDSQGVVRFAYRSQDPTDRPAIEELLRAAKELKKNS